jgi:hypothetical protein
MARRIMPTRARTSTHQQRLRRPNGRRADPGDDLEHLVALWTRWTERQPGLLEPASPSAEAVERSLQKSIATGDQHLGGEVGPALAGS